MSSHLKCKNKPVRVSRTSRVNRVKDNRDKDNRVKDNRVKDNRVKDNRVKDNRDKDNRVKDNRDKDNRVKDNRDKDNRVKDNRVKMRAAARKGPAAVKRKKIKTAKTARVRHWMILSIRP